MTIVACMSDLLCIIVPAIMIISLIAVQVVNDHCCHRHDLWAETQRQCPRRRRGPPARAINSNRRLEIMGLNLILSSVARAVVSALSVCQGDYHDFIFNDVGFQGIAAVPQHSMCGRHTRSTSTRVQCA